MRGVLPYPRHCAELLYFFHLNARRCSCTAHPKAEDLSNQAFEQVDRHPAVTEAAVQGKMFPLAASADRRDELSWSSTAQQNAT